MRRPAHTGAIKKREQQADALESELSALVRREQVSQVEVARLEGLARDAVLGWRKTLRKHIPQARQILQKMLRDRLMFHPEERQGQRGYRFTGQGSIMPLLGGFVPPLSLSFLRDR
jgi:hypothetical protein